jgi:predicted RNA-binding protein associated with RNAse of E/G family
MHETVVLDLPEQVTQRARQIAVYTQRRLEDVLLDWLVQSSVELPVEMLADDQVLALAKSQLSNSQQVELSDLLAANREGQMSVQQQARLDELMIAYRHGLVRKAQAVKTAVSRGLVPPLN